MGLFSRKESNLGSKSKSTPADFLVVGLGNPGEKYFGTRHNAGGDCISYICERHNLKLKADKSKSFSASKSFNTADSVEVKVVFARPTTFMNNSGEAVKSLANINLIEEPTQIIVVHDELDLEVGTSRVKLGGGLAGHNGLKSIKSLIGSDNFIRVRIGIDRPPGQQNVSDYVLKRPSKQEADTYQISIAEAADALEKIITDGADAAMAQYNQK